MQGLGGGGLMTLSQSLISESVPPRDRARYQGISRRRRFLQRVRPRRGRLADEPVRLALHLLDPCRSARRHVFARRCPGRRRRRNGVSTRPACSFRPVLAPVLVALEQIRVCARAMRRPSRCSSSSRGFARAARAARVRIRNRCSPSRAARDDHLAIRRDGRVPRRRARLADRLSAGRSARPSAASLLRRPAISCSDRLRIGLGSVVTDGLSADRPYRELSVDLLIPVALGLFFVALSTK